MRATFVKTALLLSCFAIGCQSISGVGDLTVVDDPGDDDEMSDGSGGSGGDGGSSNDGGNGGSGGSGGSEVSGGSGGTDGSGGTSGSGGGDACPTENDWVCNLVEQCGCDGDDKCSYDVDVDRAVCGSVGDVEPYAGCQYNTDCPSGYACIGSACKKYCTSEDDCEFADSKCLGVTDNGEPIPGVSFCTADCDLVDPSQASDGSGTCEEGATCFPSYDEDLALEHTDCLGSNGAGTSGDDCENLLDCAPGFHCNTLDYTCHRWCRGDDDCDDDDECYGFNTPLFDGDEQVGACFSCEIGDDDECSVYPINCGCDGDLACQVTDFETGGNTCETLGSVDAYEVCLDPFDCAPGLGCVSSICVPYCSGDDSTCAIGTCTEPYYNDVPIPDTYYCPGRCEPVSDEVEGASDVIPCGDGTTCLPVPADNEVGGAFCAYSYGIAEGGTCEFNSDCDYGLGCLDGECVRWCRNDEQCPESAPNCLFGFDRYAASGDEVGLCVP